MNTRKATTTATTNTPSPGTTQSWKGRQTDPESEKQGKIVLHYENLKLYLSLGLKLTKVHRGIKFNERAWLKDNIQLNTDLRTKGTTDFERDSFKLMNNPVFGKTMENIRNRVDVRLVTKEEQLEKLAKKPNFDRVNTSTPSSRAHEKDHDRIKKTYIPRNEHPRAFQNADVRFPLQLHQEKIRRASKPPVHRHRLAVLRNQNGRLLQGHLCGRPQL